MANRPYKKTKSAALVPEYNRLKQAKTRAKTKEDKNKVQKQIDEVVSELNSRGLNTRGTEKKEQGHNFAGCHCSAAEKMLGQHRPNCGR